MNPRFPKSLADWRHDLRTPAGHITGYAEMIEEELEGEEYSGLRGRLVTQTGQPMRRAYVQVRILTPSGVPTFAGATAEIAGDGGFSVGGLVP